MRLKALEEAQLAAEAEESEDEEEKAMDEVLKMSTLSMETKKMILRKTREHDEKVKVVLDERQKAIDEKIVPPTGKRK